MSDEQHTVHVVILCHDAPDNPHFGLQDKAQQLYPGSTQPDGTVKFECQLRAERSSEGKPNFLGAFAHGTPADRFLYLTLQDSGQQIIRRTKIKLTSITWAQIEAAKNGVIEAEIDASRSGTVPLLGDGWQVRK